MDTLIIGTGLLGENLVRHLREEQEVSHTWRSDDPLDGGHRLDITDDSAVAGLLEDLDPDSAVLTAAHTDVDGCEENPEKAFAVNAEAPGTVARACRETGTHLVHVSTDYVFDGERGDYTEGDETDPVNTYGESKLRGEENVLSEHPDAAVARTSVIWGWERPNFATWVLNSLKNEEEIDIIDDQHITPTLNTDLSRQIQALVETGASGVFHTAGGTKVNRYEFATALAERFGHDTGLIKRSKREEMDWTANRPRDTSLRTEKIQSIQPPMTLEEALDTFHQEEQQR